MDEAGEKLKRAFTGAFALLFAVIVLCAVFCNQNVFGTQSPRQPAGRGAGAVLGACRAPRGCCACCPPRAKGCAGTLLAAFFTLCFLAQAHVGRALVVGATGDWDFGISCCAPRWTLRQTRCAGRYLFQQFPQQPAAHAAVGGVVPAAGGPAVRRSRHEAARFGAVALRRGADGAAVHCSFCTLCAARLLGRRAGALAALLLGAATAPFLLYAPVYYTDTVTAPIPIAILNRWLRLRAALTGGAAGPGPVCGCFCAGRFGDAA